MRTFTQISRGDIIKKGIMDVKVGKTSRFLKNVRKPKYGSFSGMHILYTAILLQTVTHFPSGTLALQTNSVTQCPDKCNCTEPIENITCSNLETLPEFPAKTYSLTLVKSYILTLFNDSFTNLNKLESLTLSSIVSVRIHNNAFKGLTSLRTLIISDCSVQFENKSEVFKPVDGITTLVLRNLGLNAPIPRLHSLQENAYVSDLKEITTYLKTVEYLDISKNFLRYSEAEMQDHFVNLKVLKIQNNPFESLVDGLRGYQKSQDLEEIDLRNTLVGINKPTASFDPLKPFKKLKRLYFDRNTIKNLKEDTFSNLVNLEHISLVNCHIENAAIRTLTRLSNLTSLDISDNPALNLTQLSGLFFGLTDSKITNLTIQKSSLKELNSTLLQYAKGTKLLQSLDLSNGAITIVKTFAFPKHPMLTYLDLSQNEITRIEQNAFEKLQKLETLKLDGNKLAFLHENMFSKLTGLKWLTLSNNILREVHEKTFLDQKDLITLSLEDNFISKLPDNIFQSLSELKVLNLKHASSPGRYDITVWPKVLRNLYSLHTLNLMDNDILDIPSDSFNALKNITQLDIRRNKVFHLDDQIFQSISNVEQLILHGNQFESLNSSGFTKLTSLKELDVSLNPFHCDCNMAWFTNWYIQSNVTLYNVSITRCNTPKLRRDILLVEYSPDINECPLAQQLSGNAGIFIGITVAVIVVIILVILGWTYRGAIRTMVRRYARVPTMADPTPSFPGETMSLTTQESEA